MNAANILQCGVIMFQLLKRIDAFFSAALNNNHVDRQVDAGDCATPEQFPPRQYSNTVPFAYPLARRVDPSVFDNGRDLCPMHVEIGVRLDEVFPSAPKLGQVNPANGLPMLNGIVDVAGNPFGTDLHGH